MRKEFKQKIIRLGNECYAYKQYLLPINRFEPSVFYFKHQMGVLKNLDILKNKDFLDVGGFIGDSALVFTEYTNGKIYSFEAGSKNFENMLKTLKLNHSVNIFPYNVGLGSREETVTLRIAKSGTGSKIVDPAELTDTDEFENISITTLDNFVKDKDLDIGLIKVDIEGFEQEFLKGAEKTIRKFRPVLLLSIYHNAYDFFYIKKKVEDWHLGYSFTVSHPCDGSLFTDTLLICEPSYQESIK